MDEYFGQCDMKKVEELFDLVAKKGNELKLNNAEVTALTSMILCTAITGSRYAGDEVFRRYMLDHFLSICLDLLKEFDRGLGDDDG